jgi:beta-phosphoglucomutase
MAKGLIFDLDGTLTITQHLHYEALHRVFAGYGINYSPEEDQMKYSGRGSTYTCEQVLKEAGRNPSPEDIEQCATKKKIFYDEIIDKKDIIPIPGIQEFLARMQKAGMKMIVATGNKLEATKKILKKAGLSDYLYMIVAQQDVKNQKPAPDLFLLAAQKLGLEPVDCIVFEDAVNGVQAAKAGHFTCIAVTTGTRSEVLQAAGAAETITDYTDPKLSKFL